MTKAQKNLVFVGFVALVVAYAYYDYRSDKAGEISKSENALLFTTKADQIQQLKMESSTSGVFDLQRTSEGWKFSSPLTETADQEAVTQFIEGIAAEKSSSVLLDGNEIDWKIYGLDHPKMVISLKDNLGATTRFEISGKKNFQGESYLRKNEEKRVYVAGGSWLQKADKTASDFRDRRIARVTPADLELIQVMKGKEKFSFRKKESDWVSAEKPSWKLDQNKVRKLISSLSSNRIQKFEAKVDTLPLVTIELTSKTGRKWQGQFGINKDKKNYLQVAELGITGELQVDDANEVYKLSIDAMRDRTEPFHFHKEDVKRIEYSSDGLKFTLEMKADKWEVVSGGDASRNFVADQVKNFLGKLMDLEALEFTMKKQPPPAKGQTTHIVLKAIDDKLVFDLSWGHLDPQTLWAKSNLYPETFSLSADKTKDLNLDQVWAAKTAPVDNKSSPEKSR
jgi:hypothetical protein